MYEFCDDYERMFDNIVASAYTYIAASKAKSIIIGMSGGIDSTLTAALAQEVVKRLNHEVTLEGRIIAIESDKEEMKRADLAAEAFCHRYNYVDLSKENKMLRARIMNRPSSSYNCGGGPLTTHQKIRQANIKARLRMISLYDLANEMDGIVLSTDNYTEYLLGFWTLHGDVGDLGMIQNLWKTEVYGMAEYLTGKLYSERCFDESVSLRECIEATPTDGLGVTNSDFDQIYPEHDPDKLPAEIYRDIDIILGEYLNHSDSIYQPDTYPIESKVINRHKRTMFKRNNPFNIPREYIVKYLRSI